MSTKYENAIEEFNKIESATEGLSGSSYKSSNGYEFIIWIDNGDEYPAVESDLIEWSIDKDDDTYADMYIFRMTLKYE